MSSKALRWARGSPPVLRQTAAKIAHLPHHFVDRDLLAAGEGVLAVAPGAAHRTAGQPHESARASRMGGLSLNRAKDFSDTKHRQILDSGPLIVDLRETINRVPHLYLNGLVAFRPDGFAPGDRVRRKLAGAYDPLNSGASGKPTARHFIKPPGEGSYPDSAEGS